MLSFKNLQIEDKILMAIEELGFTEPMPVQEKVIPFLLNDEAGDLIALAQTGTGKTAAFGIPVVQKINTSNNKLQYLILSPTRELCLQISDDLLSIAKYKSKVKIASVFGGASIDRQITKIQNGVHIVSATPGRLVDLIKRNIVSLSSINTVILDEADEMLNMGFRDDLEFILGKTPQQKNTLLFSATMSDEIRTIAAKYMNSPAEITIGRKNSGAENIEHICFFVQAKDRYLALKRIVDFYPEIYGIVFCRTRKETQEVADLLLKDGYNADALHGDLSQIQRNAVMNKFRIKNLKLLVATDVAARGLDVENLSHIINYNLPEDLEIYTHRSGRTGRAGKKGISIVIANLKEKGKLNSIEKQISKKFTFSQIPSGKVICEKQLLHLIDKMEKVEVDYSQIDPYLPEIFKKLEWLDREELIKKFVSVEFNRFLDYYKNTIDLDIPDDKKSRRKSGPSELSRLFINLGKTDELKPLSLIKIINENLKRQNAEIGDIEILKNFSFFEIDSRFSSELIDSLSGKKYRNRPIIIQSADKKKDSKMAGSFDRSDRKKSSRDKRTAFRTERKSAKRVRSKKRN